MAALITLHHQRPDGEVDAYHLKSGRRYHLGRGSQCQIRILDLKLSRQHCAVEHDGHDWRLVDLASTNGCSVDGERVSGSRVLRVGSRIAAGSSTLTVQRLGDESDPEPATDAARSIPATPAGGLPAPWPQQEEQDFSPHSDRLAAVEARSAVNSGDAEPQPSPSRATISDPLIPGLPTPGVDHDVLATLPPGTKQAPATAPADQGTRTFYINVLGRRIGPLSRAQARDLKTRELKGTLTPADLAAVEAEAAQAAPPQPAASAAPAAAPAATGDEQRSFFITLLGKRVGPLTRLEARELKARELRGDLQAAEVERLAAH